MEKIKEVEEKNIACFFGLLSATTSLLSIFIAIILYMQIIPSFSFVTHFISDLGNGKNYSNIIFNLGRIISGALSILCYFLLYRFFRKKEVKLSLALISLISGIIASVGSILVGIYPSVPEPDMHRIAAILAFSGMFFVSIFYGISELTIKNFNKLYAISGFIVAPFSVIYMILYVTLYLPGINSEIPILVEWIAYFSMMVWIIFQLTYILRIK
jgi:hypothetical membrane protein